MVRLLILLFAFLFSLIAKEPICTWTSADGRTLVIFVSTLVNPIMGIWRNPYFYKLGSSSNLESSRR